MGELAFFQKTLLIPLKFSKFSACGGLNLSTFFSSIQQITKAISKKTSRKIGKFFACGGLDLSTFLSSVQQNTKAISKKSSRKNVLKSSAPQAENFQNLNADFYDLGGN